MKKKKMPSERWAANSGVGSEPGVAGVVEFSAADRGGRSAPSDPKWG
jgi:hypothetical protein